MTTDQSASDPLSFKDVLRMDLLRQHELFHPGSDLAAEGIRFWLKALSPRMLPVLLYRMSYHLQAAGYGILARICSMLNVLLFGIEIATICRIGPGLFFPHTHGTVIGAVSIGKNAVIYQGVTLGAKDLDFTYDATRRPVVGDHVLIGAGAKVLGGITLGNNVSIGANAVVLDSIPDDALAAGIPARILKRQE